MSSLPTRLLSSVGGYYSRLKSYIYVIKDIYKKMREDTRPSTTHHELITPKDWVLLFLYASPNRENLNPIIHGTLMFIKQFFVFIKEIKKDLEKDFAFFPYDYGPYSYKLKELLENLSKDNYIKITEKDGIKDYIITDKGIERAKKFYSIIDDEVKLKMENLRREATQLGYSGVLRYVYSRYPEFTTASKIKDGVIHE